MEPKKPWESKTVLLGAFSSVLAGVAMLLPAAQPVLDWLNANGAVVAMAWGFLAMALRFISKDKIQLRD